MPEPIHVLCVDDDPLDRELIRSALQAADDDFDLVEAADRESFETRLAEKAFDIVLTDFNILGFEGLQVIEAVRASCPEVPVVVITGTGSEDVAVRSIKRGAADYVIKTRQHITHLPHTIRRVLDERKTARALADTRARLTQFFEHTSSGIAIYRAVDHGADFVFVDVNPAGERIGRMARQALIGQRLTALYPGAEAMGLLGALQQVWRDGGEVFLPARTYEDQRIEQVVQNRVFKLPSGELVAVYEDMTELLTAQSALHEREAALQQVIESNADGMIVVDTAGKIQLANPASVQLLGRSQEDLVGSAFDLPLIYTEGSEIELRVRGEQRLVDMNVVKTRWQGADAWLASLRDITERRQLQASLAQSDRLSSMGMLAAGVAHEINNPLTYLLYNLEGISKEIGPLLDGVRRFQQTVVERLGGEAAVAVTELCGCQVVDSLATAFDDALAGAQRIREIVRGLGSFSRVETNTRGPVDLAAVIEAATAMATNEIKYRARLVKQLGATPPVWGCDGRLSQVVLNLVINAAHAIDEGDVEHNEIRIRTWATGDEVFFEIADTGKGIEAEQLGRLFEPFFTTKEVGVGSGLGLAISKGIVEEFDGEIEVASEVGVGTRFTVKLPACREEAVSDNNFPSDNEGPVVKGRLLLVDDELAVRSALRHVLREHTLVEAASGEAAKTILAKDRDFDLIVCDMMMPEVSGMDLHLWLVATDSALADRLVFLTGGAFTPKARAYLSSVGNPTLDKPFDVKELRALVRRRVLANRDGTVAPK